MRSEPRREIIHGDALTWLAANGAPEGASTITSLPDVSELSPLDLPAWRTFFVDAARTVIRWTPEVSIFFQSDVRHEGALVDKSYLVLRAAEEEGAHVLFHKIVCRSAPGTIAFGRPSYSHLIGVAKSPRPTPRSPGPDVIADAGAMTWSRAMGVEACRVACRYLLENTATKIVVDPFCGHGTALAVANAMGLDAIGVELSARRCRAARSLSIPASDGSPQSPDDRFAQAATAFDEGRFDDAQHAFTELARITLDARDRRIARALAVAAEGLAHAKFRGDLDASARILSSAKGKLDACVAEGAPPALSAFADALDAVRASIVRGTPVPSGIPLLRGPRVFNCRR